MQRHEVIVLGGGPAGAAAATLLARRAHEVALVRPGTPVAGGLAESIPPSARALLTELGLSDAVAAAGFHPNRGNTVRWAGAEPRVERFADDATGVHVERADLERVLVAAAEAVGVRTLEATAREAHEADGMWTVRCDTPDGASVRLEAPWVVDATGRHGLVARREGREPDRSTTTLAFLRTWRVDPDAEGGAGAEGHTLVESYDDGWAWIIPLDATTRCVAAMVDQRAADLSGADPAAILDAELAKAPHLVDSLRSGGPVGDAWACPASLYTAHRFGRPGLLLAGDAASAIDPLSSFGVKKALASGWLAGVAVHTSLVDGPMTDGAVHHFDAHERAAYMASREASIAFFDEAAHAYGHPFWSERASGARAAVVGAVGALGPDATVGPSGGTEEALPGRSHVPEPAVRAAFEALRARESMHAVLGPSVSRLERTAVVGQRIVVAEHLVSATTPDGMRWVRGVDLLRLVEVATRHEDVAHGWTAYNGVASPVTLPDYLTALSTAFAADFLVFRQD